jgi:hypothetical protein
MWLNARLRENFLQLKAGQRVIFAPDKKVYKSIGPVFILFDGKQIYRVAESYAGKQLFQLLKAGKPHSDQEKCEKSVKKHVNALKGAKNAKNS